LDRGGVGEIEEPQLGIERCAGIRLQGQLGGGGRGQQDGTREQDDAGTACRPMAAADTVTAGG